MQGISFILTTGEKALGSALEHEGAKVDVWRLHAADVATLFGPALVGIEVKSAQDLVGSFRDKQKDGQSRLNSQLSRMMALYDYCFLMVWGWMLPMDDGGIRTDDWENPHKGLWDGLWNTLLGWSRGLDKKGKSVLNLQLAGSRVHAAHRIVSMKRFADKRRETWAQRHG